MPAATASNPEQQRFPCCPMFLVDIPSPTTPAKRIEPVVQFVRSVPAFAQSRQGRPSHRVLRDRLCAHTYYGLRTCRRPDAATFPPSFDHFFPSIAAGIATGPGRSVGERTSTCWNNASCTAHLDQHTSVHRTGSTGYYRPGRDHSLAGFPRIVDRIQSAYLPTRVPKTWSP